MSEPLKPVKSASEWDTAILSDKADRLLRAKEPAKAVRVLEDALQSEPANLQLLKKYGHALSLIGEYRKAQAAFARALELEPQDAESICSHILTQLDLLERKPALDKIEAVFDNLTSEFQARIVQALAVELRLGRIEIEEISPRIQDHIVMMMVLRA